MSESAEKIIEALRGFFTPKPSGAHWANLAPKQPQAAADPHGYRLGVRDELEILETAEETCLWSHSPDLVNQRRLRRTDRFCVTCAYTSPTRIEIDKVVMGDGFTKVFYGQRALLSLREHAGRVIQVVQLPSPTSVERFLGTEQPRMIVRHGLAWIELDSPIDTEHRSYPAVLFD